MLFVTGLLIYHISLIYRNVTTKEELGGYYENYYGNPYKRYDSPKLELSVNRV